MTGVWREGRAEGGRGEVRVRGEGSANGEMMRGDGKKRDRRESSIGEGWRKWGRGGAESRWEERKWREEKTAQGQ